MFFIMKYEQYNIWKLVPSNLGLSLQFTEKSTNHTHALAINDITESSKPFDYRLASPKKSEVNQFHLGMIKNLM